MCFHQVARDVWLPVSQETAVTDGHCVGSLLHWGVQNGGTPISSLHLSQQLCDYGVEKFLQQRQDSAWFFPFTIVQKNELVHVAFC